MVSLTSSLTKNHSEVNVTPKTDGDSEVSAKLTQGHITISTDTRAKSEFLPPTELFLSYMFFTLVNQNIYSEDSTSISELDNLSKVSILHDHVKKMRGVNYF